MFQLLEHRVGLLVNEVTAVFKLTYLLTPCSRVLLENLTDFQLIKKFREFYGTRRFTNAYTSAHHLSLSWARSIQSIPPHPTSWRSISILSSHLSLGLPSGLFPSSFLTKTLHTPLLSPIRVTSPAHLTRDFITRTILGGEYGSFSSSMCSFELSDRHQKYFGEVCLNFQLGLSALDF